MLNSSADPQDYIIDAVSLVADQDGKDLAIVAVLVGFGRLCLLFVQSSPPGSLGGNSTFS